MRFRTAIPPRRVISLTPLIDVVFLLLLFFMLASSFDRYSSIAITTVRGPGSDQAASRPILVRLRAGGRADVNGVATAIGDLADRLRTFEDLARTRIVLAVGEAVETQALVDALGQLDRSGAVDVVVSR